MRLTAALLLCCSVPAAAAELYRWTDAQGRVHYSEVRPRQGTAQEVTPAPPSSGDSLGSLRSYAQQLQSGNAERDRKRAQAEQMGRERHTGCLQARAEMRLRDQFQGRTFTLDEQGERVMLTPEQEAAARAGTQQRITDNCGE